MYKTMTSKLTVIIAAALTVLSITTTPIVNAKGKEVKTPTVQTEKKININKADAEQLAKMLKGVGLKKAQAIVDYRKQYGAFKSIDELTAVKGIGKKTVKKNSAVISI